MFIHDVPTGRSPTFQPPKKSLHKAESFPIWPHHYMSCILAIVMWGTTLEPYDLYLEHSYSSNWVVPSLVLRMSFLGRGKGCIRSTLPEFAYLLVRCIGGIVVVVSFCLCSLLCLSCALCRFSGSYWKVYGSCR